MNKSSNKQIGILVALLGVSFYLLMSSARAAPGEVYAVNFADMIVKINPDNTIAPFFVLPEGGGGQMDCCPAPLAFDSRGNLYAGSFSGNIIKINSDGMGSLFSTMGNIGYSYASFAFDKNDNLFVSNSNTVNQPDNLPYNIYKYSPSGSKSLFASSEWGSGGIFTGLAFDRNGYLYAGQVDFLGADGKKYGLISKFSDDGSSAIFAIAEQANPRAIAFDSFGNLFVAEPPHGTFLNSVKGRILKYTPDGSFSVFADGYNVEEGIAFDVSGNLLVGLHSTIIKFSPDGIASPFGPPLGPFQPDTNFWGGIAVEPIHEPASMTILIAGMLSFAAFRQRNIISHSHSRCSCLGRYAKGSYTSL